MFASVPKGALLELGFSRLSLTQIGAAELRAPWLRIRKKERWAGLGGLGVQGDDAAGDDPRGGVLPHDGEEAGHGEATSAGVSADTPWWWERYREWRRQGWSDPEIFEYLGQWDDSHSDVEWPDRESSVLTRWNDGSEKLTHWNDGSRDACRWNEQGSGRSGHFAGWLRPVNSRNGDEWQDPGQKQHSA